MYKIIGADGKEYGPISAEQLRQWIAENRVNAQTRVQPEGSSEWKLLGEVVEFAAPPAGTPPPIGLPPPAPDAGRHRFTEFPVVAVVLLHFFTCGLFSFFWLNLMHGKLPKVRPDDPSAGRAIGFCFIPFFNLYWIFFSYRRLCVRIDEQRELYGLPPSNLKGLATTACIFQIIPYLNIFIGYTIMTPLFLGKMQSSVNELVRTSATTAPRAVLPTLAPPSGTSGPAIALIVLCVAIIPLIGILAALLLPALSVARNKARAAVCMSHVKLIGLACDMYAGSNGGRLPQTLDSLTNGNLPSTKILICPAAKDQTHYSYAFTGVTNHWMDNPDVVILREIEANHFGRRTLLYNDGHVEQRKE